jgi:hypothetical protein
MYQILDRTVSETGDIQKRDFICTFHKIPMSEFDGFTKITDLTLPALFAHVVLVALRDDEIPCIV